MTEQQLNSKLPTDIPPTHSIVTAEPSRPISATCIHNLILLSLSKAHDRRWGSESRLILITTSSELAASVHTEGHSLRKPTELQPRQSLTPSRNMFFKPVETILSLVVQGLDGP